MKLAELGEFDLIERIKKSYGSENGQIVRGIGDDAAALKVDTDSLVLTTTDMLLENVHFDLKYFSAYDLGKKAIAVNISDIAAMGGSPRWVLTSIGLPESIDDAFVEQFYKGMSCLSDRFGIKLIGGDTVASRGGVVINVQLMGTVNQKELILRRGARAGDQVFVTGALGGSSAGLEILKKGLWGEKNRDAYEDSVTRHLTPSPRVDEARYLAASKVASSMIDISDGLIQDLDHICTESNVQGKLLMAAVPVSDSYQYICKEMGLNSHLPLCGGEDYELLFTVPPDRIGFVDSFRALFSCGVTRVGEICHGNGVSVYDEQNNPVELDVCGYDHFKS